jgi:hypothetical protein
MDEMDGRPTEDGAVREALGALGFELAWLGDGCWCYCRVLGGAGTEYVSDMKGSGIPRGLDEPAVWSRSEHVGEDWRTLAGDVPLRELLPRLAAGQAMRSESF